MKGVLLNLLAVILIAGGARLSTVDAHGNDVTINEVQPHPPERSSSIAIENRYKRQTDTTTTTTTTPKPRKHRPSNIFNLISVLISETREDTNRAFNEIGTLFNSQFSNETTTKTPTTSTTPTSPSTSDDDATTTTAAPPLTRDEVLAILRSNVQGIANLVGREFRVAIKDSNQNVREFGRDFGNALAPYFTNNNTNTNTNGNYKNYH